jgi:hypothetical protein
MPLTFLPTAMLKICLWMQPRQEHHESESIGNSYLWYTSEDGHLSNVFKTTNLLKYRQTLFSRTWWDPGKFRNIWGFEISKVMHLKNKLLGLPNHFEISMEFDRCLRYQGSTEHILLTWMILKNVTQNLCSVILRHLRYKCGLHFPNNMEHEVIT